MGGGLLGLEVLGVWVRKCDLGCLVVCELALVESLCRLGFLLCVQVLCLCVAEPCGCWHVVCVLCDF